MGKLITKLSLLTILWLSAAHVAMGQAALVKQTAAAEDSVLRAVTVLYTKCSIEAARVADVQARLIELERNRIKGLQMPANKTQPKVYNNKFVKSKNMILLRLLPQTCYNALSRTDLLHLTAATD